MGIAFTVPFKLWFSYILFKYAHQPEAIAYSKLQREETVKEVKMEIQKAGEVQEVGEPVQAVEANYNI